MGVLYLTKSFYVIWVVDSDMKSSRLLECKIMNHSIIDGTHDLQVFLKFFQICVRLFWWKFGKKHWKGRVCPCKLFWKHLIWLFFFWQLICEPLKKQSKWKKSKGVPLYHFSHFSSFFLQTCIKLILEYVWKTSKMLEPLLLQEGNICKLTEIFIYAFMHATNLQCQCSIKKRVLEFRMRANIQFLI